MPASTPPLVSVLCLTYRHAAYLAQALEGMLMQRTSFGVEIVVGEDASGDGTADVLRDYAARHPGRIVALIAERNLGMVANFRRTLARCRGRYIAICEGDDYWTDPLKLQKQVDFLEAHPEYVLCFHDALERRGAQFSRQPYLTGALRQDASALQLQLTRPISTLTVCFRNVVRDIPPALAAAPVLDLCMWSLLGQHGAGKFMPDIGPAIYRVHAGGAMSTRSRGQQYRMTMGTLSLLALYWEAQGKLPLARALCQKVVDNAVRQMSMQEKRQIDVDYAHTTQHMRVRYDYLWRAYLKNAS